MRESPTTWIAHRLTAALNRSNYAHNLDGKRFISDNV